MRNKSANEKSEAQTLTTVNCSCLILWMGDGSEPNLEKYFSGYIPEPGWYALRDFLAPFGPYDTSTEAYDAINSHMGEK